MKPAPASSGLYTLSVVVKLTGVSRQAILRYREMGLIVPAEARGRGQKKFDDETLRTLRRIEHLRTRYEMNLRSLKLTLSLLRELERLRDDSRLLRR